MSARAALVAAERDGLLSRLPAARAIRAFPNPFEEER
jgi:hypothetical protein